MSKLSVCACTVERNSPDFIEWAYRQIGRSATKDDQNRKVYVTPYLGHYGHAGYVVTIDGSPTRFTGLIQCDSDGKHVGHGRCVLLSADKTIQGERQGLKSQASKRRFDEFRGWITKLLEG